MAMGRMGLTACFGMALAVALSLAVPSLAAAPAEAPERTGTAKPDDNVDFIVNLIMKVGRMVGVEARQIHLAREKIPETIYIARMQDGTCGESCKTIFFLDRIGPNSVVGIFELGRTYALTDPKDALADTPVARPVFRFASGDDRPALVYFQGGRMHLHRGDHD